MFGRTVEYNSRAVSRTHFYILNNKVVINNQTIKHSLPVLKVIALVVDKKVQNMRIGSIMIKHILQKQYSPMRFLHQRE